MLQSQHQARINLTRLKVTTYLYLSPSVRARSLSTPITVSVWRETPHKNISNYPRCK